MQTANSAKCAQSRSLSNHSLARCRRRLSRGSTISLFVTVFLAALMPARTPMAGTETRTVGAGIPRFTFEQALLSALQRNPQIQNARQEIERTKGFFLEMRGQLLPRIDATSSVTNTDPHLSTIGTGSGSGSFEVATSYTVAITVTQSIFTGGRLSAQVRMRIFSGTRATSRSATRSTWSSQGSAVNWRYHEGCSPSF